MAQISTGGSVAGKANVDANFNLNANLPVTETQAGFACLSSEVDAGSVTGNRLQRAGEVTDDYRLRVAIDSMLLNQSFSGAILSSTWVQAITTATIVQGAGVVTLNSVASVASGATALLQTRKQFPLYGTFGLHVETQVALPNFNATNAQAEWGLMLCSGVTAPLDGVFWRCIAGGDIQGVMNYGGVENVVDMDESLMVARDGTPFVATEVNKYVIVTSNDAVFFWVNDILCAEVTTPTNQGTPTLSTSLPLAFRTVNTAAASAAKQIALRFANILLGDGITNRPYSQMQAGNGAGSYQTQPGVAVAQTSNAGITALAAPTYTANTAPANAALGGKWITPSPMPAGTSGLATVVDVHYPVFSYLNPAGTTALPGKDLVIKGIRVGETTVLSVLGATFTLVEWIVGVGSSAASLATADAVGPPTTVAPKRVPVGSQGFLATAPAGTVAPGFYFPFETPLVVPPGSYFHIIQAFIGNAATGVLRGSVHPVGEFE